MRPDTRLRALGGLLALLAVLAGAGAVSLAHAQAPADESAPLPEDPTPLPTGLRTSGLIPVTIPGSGLRFGIDPESVSVGKDDVIRYVVVATSGSGALNAMQEGVRCRSREVKTYARYTPGGGWASVEGAAWRPLTTGTAVTRHSAIIARNGLCGFSPESAVNRDAAKVLRDLRSNSAVDPSQ